MQAPDAATASGVSGPAAGMRSVSTAKGWPATTNASASSSFADGVALQENGYGDARRVPVQRCGRRVGGGGQGDAGGGERVGGFPRASVIVAPDQVALGGDRHVRDVHRAALRHTAASSDMCGRSSCQTPAPMTVSGFGAETLRAHQARHGAVGGLEDRVDLSLDGGRVFLQVDAERQQAAGRRPGRGRAGRAGQREQHRTRPEVGPAPCRYAFQGRAWAGGGELGGEAVEQRSQPAQGRVRKHRRDDAALPRDHVVCRGPAIPSAPDRTARNGQRQAGSPVAARRALGRPTRLRGRPVASATWAHQRVVDGAEQRGAGGGEGDELVLARDSRCHLLRPLRRLGKRAASPRRPAASRARPTAWAGCGRSRPATRAWSKASTAARASSSPATGSASRSARITPTTLARAGNHCISGKGAVVGASSR